MFFSVLFLFVFLGGLFRIKKKPIKIPRSKQLKTKQPYIRTDRRQNQAMVWKRRRCHQRSAIETVTAP